jgi:hypothetical protein
MYDEREKLETAEVEPLDEDPPREADFLRQLNEDREPADDDPPVESGVPPDVVRARTNPSPPESY